MGFTQDLIAPCGMNCGTCLSYLRKENRCPGCTARPLKCGRKVCSEHKKASFTYCFECPKFPCEKMNSLEKRYVERYHLSVFDNLRFIKENGIDEFIESEDRRWICKNCGEVLCVHQDFCSNCQQKYRT
jgi:hypothetical protein